MQPKKMLYDVDKVGVHATRVGSRVDYELIALTSDVIKTMYWSCEKFDITIPILSH